MQKNILVTSLAVLLLYTLPVYGQSGANTSEVLVQVGDEKLTTAMLEAHIKTLPPQVQEMLKQNPGEKKRMLDNWVEMTLWAKEGQRLGLENTPEVKAKIHDVQNGILAMAAREAALAEVKKVSEEELKAYYDGHGQDFKKAEEVRAQHILIKVPEKAGPEAEEKAKATIREIQDKLGKGESFATLATQYSEDPGSKARGGDLGFFKRGRMVPEFEAVAFTIPVGQVSEPFRSKFGFHLLKVNEKNPEQMQEFGEVKEKIETLLMEQKKKSLAEERTEALKAKYPVTVNLDALK